MILQKCHKKKKEGEGGAGWGGGGWGFWKDLFLESFILPIFTTPKEDSISFSVNSSIIFGVIGWIRICIVSVYNFIKIKRCSIFVKLWLCMKNVNQWPQFQYSLNLVIYRFKIRGYSFGWHFWFLEGER